MLPQAKQPQVPGGPSFDLPSSSSFPLAAAELRMNRHPLFVPGLFPVNQNEAGPLSQERSWPDHPGHARATRVSLENPKGPMARARPTTQEPARLSSRDRSPCGHGARALCAGPRPEPAAALSTRLHRHPLLPGSAGRNGPGHAQRGWSSVLFNTCSLHGAG